MHMLSSFPTSTISDALDRLGINGQLNGIRPMNPGARLIGRAFTVAYQPMDVGGGTVGDYIDDVPPGAVVVLDNGGRTDATVWGDLLTLVAFKRNVGGTVINGVCRDAARCAEINYPIFAVDRWMRTGKDRVKVAAVDVPVTAGNVRVRPGDLVIGDDDGVLVVPAGFEDKVSEAAIAIDVAEQRIRAEVLVGGRLDQARAGNRYHDLQHRAIDGSVTPMNETIS